MKLAAVDPTIQQLFGTVAAPTGVPTDVGAFIGGLINIFLIVAGIAVLIYMLAGAFDWIISGGDKERIAKAQQKITNAVIGIIIVIFALALFNVIATQVLHIFTDTGSGWQINLPKIGP